MSIADYDHSIGCFSERMMMSQKMLGEVKLEDGKQSKVEKSSLIDCYNERIRPLLDAVDKLRNLDVMKEGIQLPSIVVVGDQSSGKSSVLESLAGISLPRGQGICTRVPLVMRLQSCGRDESEIIIEYKGKTKSTPESEIKAALEIATEEIAGSAKGISDTPITLHVRKPNAPDLTMVDLPGITRVPVHDQPEDIYEQISQIIMRYITPKESIILNVLAANVDFPTCESIRMSQRVDEQGERTLAVVTKVDKAPEGLLEKVTVDAVNIGLGYVCVRNRVGDESMQKARKIESELFSWHPQLSKIDKSMVGIPMLAKRLMQIQAASISKCLPDIVKKINTTLSKRQSDLSVLPQHFSSPSEAVFVFIKMMNAMKECLNRILIQGDFEQFPDEPQMHCTARLREMFDGYYKDLCQTGFLGGGGREFLLNAMQMLEEAKGVGLPNFLPRPVFLILLGKRVDDVWDRSLGLVSQVWDYLEGVILRVVELQTRSYPQLHTATRRAAQALVQRKKAECVEHVEQMLETEKFIDFTLNPVYMETYSDLIRKKDGVIRSLRALVEKENRLRQEWEMCHYSSSGQTYKSQLKKSIAVEGIGEVDVSRAMEMPIGQVEEAFDMEMSVMAYWKVVIVRLGDGIPLHLQLVVRKLVKNEVEGEILREAAGPKLNAMEKMLEESPVVANKRKSLMNSVDLLRESKAALSNIMDRIAEA